MQWIAEWTMDQKMEHCQPNRQYRLSNLRVLEKPCISTKCHIVTTKHILVTLLSCHRHDDSQVVNESVFASGDFGKPGAVREDLLCVRISKGRKVKPK